MKISAKQKLFTAVINFSLILPGPSQVTPTPAQVWLWRNSCQSNDSIYQLLTTAGHSANSLTMNEVINAIMTILQVRVKY